MQVFFYLLFRKIKAESLISERLYYVVFLKIKKSHNSLSKSSVPSERISTSEPVNSRNDSPSDSNSRFSDWIVLICFLKRLASNPFAWNDEREWSVTAQYAQPKLWQYSIISSRDCRPSLQFEWLWSDPRSSVHSSKRGRLLREKKTIKC